MKYSVEYAKKLMDSENRLKYVFFWGHNPSADGSIGKECFSQWYECNFTVDGVLYHTAEQYMMAQKAILFGDGEVYNEIMNASHPNQYKALGRKIKNFNEKIWHENRTDIVIRGNFAKFSQNPEIRDFLVNTGSRVIVEASPYDRIWGIGMSAKNPDSTDPEKWRGLNLLGFCLMEVRDMVK